MIMKSSAMSLRDVSRIFFSVTLLVMFSAALCGTFGAVSGDPFLNKVHPYLFFTGFGNLAILLLNRYLTAAIYPELSIDPVRQMRFVFGVLAALAMAVASLLLGQPLLKAGAGLLMMAVTLVPLVEILKKLSVAGIWRDVSARYYIFDVVFLLNANLGLFTLGLKEAFPANGIIPFFVTQSAYFLGSSFPLSISVMGFLYTYAWRKTPARELATKLFSLWFFIFIGGVLFFLVVILIGHYLGMMLISHVLTFGVIALLISFTVYLQSFFSKNFAHPALAFMLGGLALLLATCAYGILNVYFIKGISFGSYPPIRADKMWIYHSHTHSALLGWISLSFIGMIHIVIPAIQKYGSLELLESGNPFEQILDKSTMARAFLQLSVMLVAAFVLMFAFYSEDRTLMGVAGTAYALSLLDIRRNLFRDPAIQMKNR